MSKLTKFVPILAVLVLGCSSFKTAPADDKQVKIAVVAGSQAGNSACIVALAEKPGIRPQLVKAVASGKEVLASPDPTVSAINEVVINTITDTKTRMYVSLGVSSLLTSLTAAGVDVTTIQPGSPISMGLGAFFDYCDKVLDGSV